jgi:hypothetical protein
LWCRCEWTGSVPSDDLEIRRLDPDRMPARFGSEDVAYRNARQSNIESHGTLNLFDSENFSQAFLKQRSGLPSFVGIVVHIRGNPNQPNVIAGIHESYLGADHIVSATTF